MKLLLMLLLAAGVGCTPPGPPPFTLRSADIPAGSEMPRQFEFNGFGCKGNNQSPELHWLNAPEGTKSFAVTVYDRDAPSGSGWWHWMVVNLPAGTTRLSAGAGDSSGASLPAGAQQLRNDFGTVGWGGACPPAGARSHRYVFSVYALKVERLEVPSGASAAFVGYMIRTNAIGRSQFFATYGR
jgi:Raf kinase inhibitor-like YbhB/YbcL family protein